MSTTSSFRVGGVSVRRVRSRADGSVYWRAVVYTVRGETTLWCQWSSEEEARERAAATEADPRVPRRTDIPQRLLRGIRGGCVYFARAGQDGPIKIGFSERTTGRLYTLQTGSAEPLTLLAAVPGRRKEERSFHRAFAHLRIRGEWFRAGESLLALVAEFSAAVRVAPAA